MTSRRHFYANRTLIVSALALGWSHRAHADNAVDEVRVTGNRSEPRSSVDSRMTRSEIRTMPGALGDPFRAIDALPTITPLLSGFPYYIVRGASPATVGYYVDEVRVPYLFHFGLGPGVIQPALIDDVTLHPSAYPGRYGRFAGAIVAGATRAPATELAGEGLVRIFDAGAYVEAPVLANKGSIGVGGRYAYPGFLLSLLSPDTNIDYRDYNVRASYALSDRWRATAFAFGSFDYAADKSTDPENVIFASEFHRLDLRFDRRGAHGGTTRIAATLGLDRTRLGPGFFARSFPLGIRARHGWAASPQVAVDVLQLSAHLLRVEPL
jgi:hypothetical protein